MQASIDIRKLEIVNNGEKYKRKEKTLFFDNDVEAFFFFFLFGCYLALRTQKEEDCYCYAYRTTVKRAPGVSIIF